MFSRYPDITFSPSLWRRNCILKWKSSQALLWFDAGEELPPLQLNDEVFKSIGQLYDCLLTEVQERGKKGLPLAKKLNSSLGFFCYDLLSVIEPRQVFELVGQLITTVQV
jgi:hypothetical protein